MRMEKFIAGGDEDQFVTVSWNNNPGLELVKGQVSQWDRTGVGLSWEMGVSDTSSGCTYSFKRKCQNILMPLKHPFQYHSYTRRLSFQMANMEPT
jgi:hypothetical protein